MCFRKDLGDKSDVKEVIDGEITIKSHTSGGKSKKKLKYRKYKGNPHLLLVPQSFFDVVIENKVKSKGISQPFAKVRAILTSDFKDKGHDDVKRFISSVLKLKIFGYWVLFWSKFPFSSGLNLRSKI